MAKPTSPRNLYSLCIFPSPPSSSTRIRSRISLNIKTIIHPFAIPDVTTIIITLIPKAKALLLRFSKEVGSHLRITPETLKTLVSLLGSIDIKAFVDGFIVPCLKKLAELKLVGRRVRVKGYAVARRIRLSFSRKFTYRMKMSSLSSYYRFHYNWSSRSYVFPIPATGLAGLCPNSCQFGDSNNKYNGDHSFPSSDLHFEVTEEFHVAQLDGYLEWLEQRCGGEGRDSQSSRGSSVYIMSDVDVLAEKFIQEKYEMFVLEKQESERMFREMMARSL